MFAQGHLSVSGAANTGMQVWLMTEPGLLTIIWDGCDLWKSSALQNIQWESEGEECGEREEEEAEREGEGEKLV